MRAATAYCFLTIYLARQTNSVDSILPEIRFVEQF